MKRRRPAMRIAIRRARRHARVAKDWDAVATLTTALSDRDIMDETLVRLSSKYAGNSAMSENALGDGSFLQFLIDNWEEILEIILTIIGLFG